MIPIVIQWKQKPSPGRVDEELGELTKSFSSGAGSDSSVVQEWDTSQWKEHLTERGAVLDVKGIVPREITSELGASLWRL